MALVGPPPCPRPPLCLVLCEYPESPSSPEPLTGADPSLSALNPQSGAGVNKLSSPGAVVKTKEHDLECGGLAQGWMGLTEAGDGVWERI